MRRPAADRPRTFETRPASSSSIKGTPSPLRTSRSATTSFGPRHRIELRASAGRFAFFSRPSFGEPLLEAAVEDRDLLRAEVAEHEPAAPRSGSGRRHRRQCDRFDRCRASPSPCRSPFSARKHVRRVAVPVRNFVDVEKLRAGDMVRQIAPRRPLRAVEGMCQLEFDNHQIRLAKVLSEPFRRDEIVHARRIGGKC